MTGPFVSIRVKIDKKTKEIATKILKDLGITPAEMYRILMRRIVKEGKIPFDIKVPSAATREAMSELEEGRGFKCGTIEELMADLNAED